jgi:ATPase subunit of ABC transporter with duplicated ATPase domains
VLGSFLFSGDDSAKPARVLSGGEKTRLALATLVVSAANVLLLDEPTNNLDPASRQEVLGAIRSYAGAIVLVTHDEGAVAALQPDRVLILPDGDEDLWDIWISSRWPDLPLTCPGVWAPARAVSRSRMPGA